MTYSASAAEPQRPKLQRPKLQRRRIRLPGRPLNPGAWRLTLSSFRVGKLPPSC